MISGAAKLAGVVGWPVAHSLSPLIHNAWIEALGLDAVYVPFPVAPDGLAQAVEGWRVSGVVGVNVTVPHKTAAVALARARSDAAEAAGSANLLRFVEGEVFADTTDGLGLLVALQEQAPAWSPARGPVVVLGAGGAASGAIGALLDAGVEEVRVAARRSEAAEAVCGSRPGASPYGLSALSEALADASLVVNATSAGLNGEGELPPMDAAPTTAVFMDMVYKPLRTPFLRAAAARGQSTVDGLAMLIGQARPSFEAFFGVPPPRREVVDVRALCLRALGEG